jgi:hypothetical protein
MVSPWLYLYILPPVIFMYMTFQTFILACMYLLLIYCLEYKWEQRSYIVVE